MTHSVQALVATCAPIRVTRAMAGIDPFGTRDVTSDQTGPAIGQTAGAAVRLVVLRAETRIHNTTRAPARLHIHQPDATPEVESPS